MIRGLLPSLWIRTVQSLLAEGLLELISSSTKNESSSNQKQQQPAASSFHHEDEKKCEDDSVAMTTATTTTLSSTSSSSVFKKPSSAGMLAGELLVLMKQLTSNRSAQPDDQRFLYEQPGLRDCVLDCCHHSSSSLSETATGILWNWVSTSSSNTTTTPVVSLWMSADLTVWRHLQRLWHRRPDSNNGTTTPTMVVRRHLAAIVGTLLGHCCCGAETNHNDVAESIRCIREQSWLVPSLLAVLEGFDVDVDYRRRCMRTVRCLASCEWGRSFLQSSSSPEQPKKLEEVLLEVLRTDDVAPDTRTLACQTVTALLPSLAAASSSSKHDSVLMGPFLETALVQIVETAGDLEDQQQQQRSSSASTTATLADKLVLAASQALCTSLRCSPWRRSASCFSELFFEQIMLVLQEQIDQSLYHVGFSGLLVELMKQEVTAVTHSAMADDSDTITTTTTKTTTQIRDISVRLVFMPPVLEILTMLLSPIAHPDFDASRQNAVHVLSVLVNDHPGNKKPMADDEYLLTALVNLCLMYSSNEGSPLKDAAKQLILALVPEL